MAEKIPGKPRKSTSRKKETEQKSQKASPVTPIDQPGLGQNQGKTSQPPTLTGSRQGSPTTGQSESSAQDRAGQFSSQRGAHPTADQSGAVTPSRLPIPSAKDAERMGPANPARTAIPDRAKAAQSGNPGAGDRGAGKTPNPTAKSAGSSPSVLNPSGSVQEGRHASGARLSGQELQERIRARAYELFEQRGRQEGFHQQDWAQAEAEVLSEFEREKSA